MIINTLVLFAISILYFHTLLSIKLKAWFEKNTRLSFQIGFDILPKFEYFRVLVEG